MINILHIVWSLIIARQQLEPDVTSFASKKVPLFIFFKFIYLFLAVLGLRFCARTFSSCGERGPLFIAVRGPLTVAASLVAEHRLQTRRLSSCGSRAQLLCGMWDLPRPGLEPVSPALAGGFSTAAPPGKPWSFILKSFFRIFWTIIRSKVMCIFCGFSFCISWGMSLVLKSKLNRNILWAVACFRSLSKFS